MSNGNNVIVVFREPENSRLKQWVNQSVRDNEFLLWVFKMYFKFFQTIEQIIEITSLKLNILVVSLILVLVSGISWNLSGLNSQRLITNNNLEISQTNQTNNLIAQISMLSEEQARINNQISILNLEITSYLNNLDGTKVLKDKINNIDLEIATQKKLQTELINPKIAELNFNSSLINDPQTKIKNIQNSITNNLKLQKNNLLTLTCLNTNSTNILEAENKIGERYQTFSKTPTEGQAITFFDLLLEQTQLINNDYQQLKTCSLENLKYQDKLSFQIEQSNNTLINISLINQYIKNSDKEQYANKLTELQSNLSNQKLSNLSKEILLVVLEQNLQLQSDQKTITDQTRDLTYLKI